MWAPATPLWENNHCSLPPSSKVTLLETPVSLLTAALSRGVSAEALHRSCVSQKRLFLWPGSTAVKLSVSGPCGSASLVVELGKLGSLPWALCPRTLSLISFCLKWSLAVSAASPRLLLSMDQNQRQETSREGRNTSVCLGVILPNVCFVRVHDSWWAPTPLTLCRDRGGTAPGTHRAQTGLLSWLYLPWYHWVPLACQGACQVEKISYILPT